MWYNIIEGSVSLELSIEIDKLTPCLLHKATGQTVNTHYDVATKKDLAGLKSKHWKFNWNSNTLENAVIYKLMIEGNSEIQGLIAVTDKPNDYAMYIDIAESAPHNLGANKTYEGVGGHLFAIAALESVKKGYDGYLFLDAKNLELVEYYKQKFGATFLGIPHPYRMYIDEQSAHKLIEIYTTKGE